MKRIQPYIPGILLFLLAFIIALLVYQDYGMAWDEPIQRETGVINYNYVFNNDQSLFTQATDHHGAAFELTLYEVEKWLHLTDSRDLYLMRHLVTHLFFLVSALSGYILVYRLFGNRFLACLGFIMLAFAPRLYAHSFFNSKDLPFSSMSVIIFALCQLAFSKKKPIYFALLGIAAGYATGIRVMGIMYAAIILVFLLIDIISGLVKREKIQLVTFFAAVFIIAFSGALYISWPYLWKAPVRHFTESYAALAHYNLWNGHILFRGVVISSSQMPWTYFPVWFLISNPPFWLLTGFGGIGWFILKLVRRPFYFITNVPDRNFLLYLLCFFAPVAAVVVFHSVIYDDWRHLYFVYPSFVLLSLYCINGLMKSKLKFIAAACCAIQVGFIGWFMVSNHPFQQVYFNAFVSHKPEYLRKNYDLEYWGCSYKQALEYLVKQYPTGTINVEWDMNPLANNIMMLQKRDRERIAMLDHAGDYRITTFRLHPEDFPYPKVEYSIQVLNSTILCVYKMH